MNLTLENVFKKIEGQKDLALKDLTDFIKIPSVSAKEQNLQEAAEFSEQLLRKNNYQTKIHSTKGGPVVTGWLDVGAKRTLLFYDHADVQPAEPFELWDSPPFELTIKNGQVFGRGVADNKGEIIVRIYAIKAWQEVMGELPCNIKFVIETEEESSSKNLASYVEKDANFLKGVDGCIWEFGGRNQNNVQEFILGVKGILYVQLSVQTLSKDAHSANAPVMTNAGERLLQAITKLKNEQNKILIPEFYTNIAKISSEEKQAIKDYKFNGEELKKSYGFDAFPRGMKEEEAKMAYFTEPTCNLCGFGSGWLGEGGKTVIPKEAMVKIDFRLVKDQDPETILNNLRKYLDDSGFPDVKIDWWNGYPAAKTPVSHEFVEICKRANKEVYNHEPEIQPTSGGSGPMHLFEQYMPIVSLGSGHADSNAHSPNENIFIVDFIDGMKCIAAILNEMKNW
ncbi:MAG: M20/M25/M40 family metallo-hydrolase [Candidatus Heimdallarchaeota archaeon]|nr:M20/M25/M40 family metallo-hydrolase [Candidatus Heimdallarchaeota archaeon]